MPDGKVLIVNGAKTGVAGYGNLVDRVGGSNADNPNFTPVLYDPDAPAGHRFTTEGMPTSTIPRLYHSVAALVPSGKIIIAGSNPNKDFTQHISNRIQGRMAESPLSKGSLSTSDFGNSTHRKL
ncbi:hypothetical protein H4Q26_001990 [Puccinia striiformis f. sp. tritici PST-130]|nr:hypothetical protein H4Q26_001990 [Puccinia striiformis f. sp. tritici PST-130]